MKNLLKSLLVVSLFASLSISATKLNALENNQANEVLVGQATTLEEKAEVALNNINLNTDLYNVVTDILIPDEGLYGSTIVWSSSDTEHASVNMETLRVTINRPALGQEAVKVTLTASLTIYENKDSNITKQKNYELRILPLGEKDIVTVQESLFEEDFSTYATGEEIGEYYSWNLSANEGVTEVVESVPNNNMIPEQKAVKINSKKTAQDVEYVRNFYTEQIVVVEGYVMHYGMINGVFFELGRNDAYGPAFGLTHESYYYSNSGKKFDTSKVPLVPTEGVWQKFRIEVDSKNRKYALKMYKMDGTNGVYTVVNNSAYSGSSAFISQFRIRVNGGDKVGQVYLSDLRIGYMADMPVNAGINPNRTQGIGEVKNFSENVLYINGDPQTYNDNIEVYNRFNKNELYVKDDDYTIVSEVVSSTDKVEQLHYTITLKETGEIKELTQTIYKEEKTGLPVITDFKGSHLARTVLEDGSLSSVGNISFSGKVTRDDGVVYYGLADHQLSTYTAETIINGGDQFVKSGSFEQTTRDVNFTINDLSLKGEYYLYVVIKNANGTSEVYSKDNITQVINITTCEEFYDMTVNVTTYQNEFRLLNDLDFSNYTWICDQTNALKFEGSFDGQNHKIKNLTIASPYRKAAVFFEITDATIKNLHFENADIYGLQDSAVLLGYSNGGLIENVSFKNCNVSYNKNAGSEGYFAIVAGRLHKGTTDMINIVMENCHIDCNKYTGALTGNVNKNQNCVLNAKNIFADVSFRCDGAAIGLIGRNRGTTNIENCVAYIDIDFAKKEMGIVAGHNKEGGELNVKNLIGRIYVGECTQPTYFNDLIGSQDDNTSSYTFENVYFFEVDYSHISDSLNPITTSRTAGVKLSQYASLTERWWEQNTFIGCFETNSVWAYDEENKRPVFVYDKQINVTAAMVNEHIAAIKNDYSEDDHYHIYQALQIYEKLSDSEKQLVDKAKLDASAKAYNDFVALINNTK